MRWVLIALCACGSDETKAVPDLAYSCTPESCTGADYCTFKDYHCECFANGTGFCEPNCMGYGCNGILNCYGECDQAAAGQSCYDDCDSNSCPPALDLLKALNDCIDANCYKALDADSGMPFCDEASMAPAAVPECNDCYQRVLGSGGACVKAENACITNRP